VRRILALAVVLLAATSQASTARDAPKFPGYSYPVFQVNTYKPEWQDRPKAAALNNGGFVIAWHSDKQDGSALGVFGQVYDAAGQPLGQEFQANTYTQAQQAVVAVAALKDGGFIVAWQSQYQIQKSSGWEIYAQRYDMRGVRVGSEFRVNTITTEDQTDPVVKGLADGGFVVLWLTSKSLRSFMAFQRFDRDGSPVGSETVVAPFEQDSSQVSYPEISAMPDGGFIVVWANDGIRLSNIFARRYSATGVPVGATVAVATTTQFTSSFAHAKVAVLKDGSFIVVWLDFNGAPANLFGQLYDAQGISVGGRFGLNATKAAVYQPSISPLADGGFVVTYTSESEDHTGSVVFGRLFDNKGNRRGPEFMVPRTRALAQYTPSVVGLNKSGFVVTFAMNERTDFFVNLMGIYAQRYETKLTPTKPPKPGVGAP
jgi:hypothetical protein